MHRMNRGTPVRSSPTPLFDEDDDFGVHFPPRGRSSSSSREPIPYESDPDPRSKTTSGVVFALVSVGLVGLAVGSVVFLAAPRVAHAPAAPPSVEPVGKTELTSAEAAAAESPSPPEASSATLDAGPSPSISVPAPVQKAVARPAGRKRSAPANLVRMTTSTHARDRGSLPPDLDRDRAAKPAGTAPPADGTLPPSLRASSDAESPAPSNEPPVLPELQLHP